MKETIFRKKSLYCSAQLFIENYKEKHYRYVPTLCIIRLYMRYFFKQIPLFFLVLLLMGCGIGDLLRGSRIVATRDAAALRQMAQDKAVSYTTNPMALYWDLRQFKKVLADFRKVVGGTWGEDNVKEPEQKSYVKYSDHFKSRAIIDFDKGLVTVETLDAKSYYQSLHKAIVHTVLAPADPSAVDLYSAREVEPGTEPFLFGQVKDQDGQNIRWLWRAERFAAYVLSQKIISRKTERNGRPVLSYEVSFPLTQNHSSLRSHKYGDIVEKYSKKYSINQPLIFAIIKTESDFNPFAVSKAPAFGLMQIVPGTAGADVTLFLTGKKGEPSKEFLFNAENNIRYGTAYLHLLKTRHFQGVTNPLSREYCMISAYNGGSGTVLRSFHNDRKQAVQIINTLTPETLYTHLTTQIPYAETRNYLYKVRRHKGLYSPKAFSGGQNILLGDLSL